jgi:hypothetical protein
VSAKRSRRRKPKPKRQLPPERLAAFDVLAAALQTDNAVVFCRDRAVKRQYQRAMAAQGGAGTLHVRTFGQIAAEARKRS